MGKNLSYVLFLLWLCYLIVSSIILFTNGFFKTKLPQNHTSTCVSYNEVPCPTSSITGVQNGHCSTEEKVNSLLFQLNSASTICLPPRSRVILIIVDALRYDFTLMNEQLNDPLPYQNKLPIISNLLNKSSESTRLFRFLADPPTTTLQRLKALTTGSLPTFIDASSNFGSTEIGEDNLIDQLNKNNYKTVFTGDDTWNGLYPNRFTRNYPFPSFDVWDLDTVDEGVRQTFEKELPLTDWHLLIGHLLGVDHCGHHHHPSHPEMARKLTEVNTFIEHVITEMSNDTILFVIGDHGMTTTGDHGGDTENEVSAALFVHSKRPLVNWTEKVDSVPQVGLVPTLATILGIPIPFENLGTLIPSCLPLINSTSMPEWQQTLYDLWANVKQIVEYMKNYADSSKDFNDGILQSIHEQFSLLNARVHTISNEEGFQAIAKDIMDFLKHLHQTCFNVWVQYDSFSMARGLLFLFLSIFFSYIIIDGIPVNQLPDIFKSSFIFCSYVAVFGAGFTAAALYYFAFVDNLLGTVFFATGVTSQFMLGVLIIQNWEVISLNWYDNNCRYRFSNLVFRLVMLINMIGLFSNSYILEEDSVLLYLLVTILVLCVCSIKLDTKKRTERWAKCLLILFAVGVAVLVRISKYFWVCREEQVWCRQQPHENFDLSRVLTTKLEWGVSVVGLAFLVMCTKIWLRNCGNLNGFSLTVLLSKYLPSVLVVCMAGYWVLTRLQLKKSANIYQAPNVLAWAVYFTTFLGIAVTIFRPMCTFLLERNEDITVENNENIIPQIFKRVKSTLMSKRERGDDVPVVCGLGTVYSAVFIILGTYLTLFVAFLLGESLAFTTVIMFFTAMCLLIILSVVRIERSESAQKLLEIQNMSILVWFILAQYFFYGTGHQATFSSIRWEAAFVGTKGLPLNHLISGSLVIINTFASNILMGFLLPLLVIAPFNVFVMLPSVITKKKEFEVAFQRGEVMLFERDEEMITNAFVLSCKYISLYGIRVFSSMLSATIHCRHLMAWAIFAPKFIFEAIGVIVTLVTVVLSFLILIRINRKVENLIVGLEKAK